MKRPHKYKRPNDSIKELKELFVTEDKTFIDKYKPKIRKNTFSDFVN
ncbi:MAG: hypothetical protein QM725_11480 [Lacibacter sp.]